MYHALNVVDQITTVVQAVMELVTFMIVNAFLNVQTITMQTKKTMNARSVTPTVEHAMAPILIIAQIAPKADIFI